MKGKKIIFLFVALLLPGCIFLFLKIFGKNQFDVEPLFQKEAPVLPADCTPAQGPFVVPDSLLSFQRQPDDSLTIIFFTHEAAMPSQSKKVFQQLVDLYENKEPVTVARIDVYNGSDRPYRCTFAMKGPADIALIDRRGVIRGQYESSDRDEIDRLKTEITIILKKY
jgi:hypothetical protein